MSFSTMSETSRDEEEASPGEEEASHECSMDANVPLTDTSPKVSPPSKLARDSKIRIQVGERMFTTTRETLVGESDYFASRLSERWNDTEPDGSYFVDGDPDMFVHILRYLRSGKPPIFYDKERGHDYGLYTALLAEAQYFQIAPLVDWLEKQKYHERVVTHRRVSMLDYIASLNETTASSEDVEYHHAWRTNHVYICPRRILVHEGQPEKCGQACHKARGTAEYEYEKRPVHDIMVIRKRTVLVDVD